MKKVTNSDKPIEGRLIQPNRYKLKVKDLRNPSPENLQEIALLKEELLEKFNNSLAPQILVDIQKTLNYAPILAESIRKIETDFVSIFRNLNINIGKIQLAGTFYAAHAKAIDNMVSGIRAISLDIKLNTSILGLEASIRQADIFNYGALDSIRTDYLVPEPPRSLVAYKISKNVDVINDKLDITLITLEEVKSQNAQQSNRIASLELEVSKLSLLTGSNEPATKAINYDKNTGQLSIGTGFITLIPNSKERLLCDILFKNNTSERKEWNIDELVDTAHEDLQTKDISYWQNIFYYAARRINDKAKAYTKNPTDKLILNTKTTKQINSLYLK